MTITALSLALTLSASALDVAPATRPHPLTVHIAQGLDLAGPSTPAKPLQRERWMVDADERRPAALPVMYATFGTLQFADAFTTRRALSAGAIETNALMRGAARHAGAMYAVKAATTAATIYLAERAWRKNTRGAVIVMAAANCVTAAIVARNLRNAR